MSEPHPKPRESNRRVFREGTCDCRSGGRRERVPRYRRTGPVRPS